jgi:hypothetical protein
LIGTGVMGWGIWANTGDTLMAVLVGLVTPIVAWVGASHLIAGAVGQLRAKKRQLLEWLTELGLEERPRPFASE